MDCFLSHRSSPNARDSDLSEWDDTIVNIEETSVTSASDAGRPTAAKRRRTDDAGPHLCLHVENLSRAADHNTLHVITYSDTCVMINREVLLLLPYFQARLVDEGGDSLLEDDPDAFHIIMIILHHRPSSLPLAMDSNGLLQLALLCKKYDVVDIVSPHVAYHGWVTKLWEGLKPVEKTSKDWFRILSTFEVHLVLENDCMADLIAANIYEQDGKWLWGTAEEVDGVLDIGTWITTPGLLGKIR
ncbi:hypothetical protein EK21DRAFT_90177 [Setomelanomma holmii]|uniref:Uncharacterized protein n=1 Tax=Setomelanomma holmii TaxID=210430 RepID=A0A9P4H795_9PLEO|nr:hypothetical protein EK21DRAFT_90177 [Setomelanomma holmii]